MEDNFSDFPQSLRTNSQSPLDAKQMFYSLEELKDLGNDNYKAYTYYNGMIAVCQEDGKWYQWTSDFRNRTKVLEQDFVYPEGIVFGGYNYSGVAFNFVEFVRDGKDGKDGKDGRDGRDGVDGQPGAPAEPVLPKYTWIMYASDENGSDISDNPIGPNNQPLEYIGIKHEQDTWPPSQNPADYEWVKYIGDQGIPGANGYMWIKYSMYSNGRDTAGRVSMHEDPYDEEIDEYMVYMGVAYNKEVQQESNVPEDYTWAKIKGNDGHSGFILDLSNDNVTIPTNADGTSIGSTALRTAKTGVKLYYGNDPIPLDDYYLDILKTPTNLDIILDSSMISDGFSRNYMLNSLFTGDTASATFVAKRTSDNSELARATFTIAKAKGLSSYSLVPSHQVFKITPANGSTPASITPSAITFKVYRNDGSLIEEVTTGKIKYKIDSGPEVEINVSGQISLQANSQAQMIVCNYHLDSTSASLDRETIPVVRDGALGQQGPQGPAGLPGTSGPILRQLEWVEGTTYYNNTTFKDYVYYRIENKWYRLRDGLTSKVASGNPSASTDWVLTNDVKGSLLAENANIGGWIMRNNMLFSQAGLVLDQYGSPLYSNIILNGLNGQINLGNNRGTLDQEGLTFRDSEQRPRIVMHWDDGSGTPILRFLNADGTIKWEAGQQGYVIITEGTQPLSWGDAKGFRMITSLANDNSLDFEGLFNANREAVISFVSPYLFPTPNSTGQSAGDLQDNQIAYFSTSSFPNNVNFSTSTKSGRANQLNKGDMASNADKHEGFYIVNSPVTTNQLPSSNLLPDGWYFAEGTSGNNGLMLPAAMDETNPNIIHYNCIIGYFRNGVRIRTVSIRVHTKTT